MSKDLSRLPPLDLLAAFEAVARQGSITRAAAERFITQSAMSRQIQALEDDLGTALFIRRHRALELTDAGRRLLAVCTTVLAQLREAAAAIRAPLAREQLAVTTTPGFAALWLIPRLAGFTGAHPGLDVRLDASFECRDLKRDGFDLAVRYGVVGITEGLRLFDEAIVPVCSPALLSAPRPAEAGRPPRGSSKVAKPPWLEKAAGAALASPADLARHTLLQVAMGHAGGGMPVEWESWLRAMGLPQVQPRSTLTLSSYNEAIAAAVAGQGIALGRRPLIDALLRKRQLVVPFGRATDTARAYFLVTAPDARRRPAVQALERWLVGQAGVAGRE